MPSDKFQNIRSIDVKEKSTWDEKYFLTIDIDWACDDVLNDTIDLIEKNDVAVTWFVTHKTDILNRLREHKKFELGIHPNFNFLLNGSDEQGANAEEVVDRILEVVPEAKTVRSHSMTQSTNILDIFKKKGMDFECNHFIPDVADITVKPWKLWNGLSKIPYSWEDDIACIYGNMDDYIEMRYREGLRVLDFHPIHVFLNTENMQRYEMTRDLHQNAPLLLEKRNDSALGARDVLKSVMEWK